MEVIFIIILVLTMWHFIYDGIILPSLRLNLRYKFFELRDKLRELKLASGEEISDEVFNYLDLGLSNSINHISIISFWFVIQVNKIVDNDAQLKKKLEAKSTIVKNCENTEIKEIYSSMVKYSFLNIVINGGGWTIYTIPFTIVLLILCLVPILVLETKNHLKNFIQKVVFTPEHKLQQIPYYPFEFN